MRDLSAKEKLILGLLMKSTDMYGLELVRRSRGSLSRGTVYVTLSRMMEKGYVTSMEEESTFTSGIPRRLYRPTALGRRAYLG